MVRSILGAHLARRHPGLPGPTVPAADPNDLVDAWTLAENLRRLQDHGGDEALRRAAEDYVGLWARTFRTLVSHLRGRPERALALFAEEVYPFLRGDRLAARVEATQAGQARVVLQGDLPAPYLAGLLEAFIGLSGAQVRATSTVPASGLAPLLTAQAAAHFSVTWRLEGFDRLARVAQGMATQRLHLLACAALAAAVGVAFAIRLAGAVEAWRAAAILLGALTAQMGANALHDLRHAHPAGPLDLRAADRRATLWQARLGYGIATLCGATLAVASPIVVAFAAVGLGLSLAFGHLKNVGWGPLLAGVIDGPLIALGALFAAAPILLVEPTAWAVAAATVPMGALAAAVLYVDDLADKPLDEAGGLRTLLVRLPRRRHLIGYAALVLGGIATLGSVIAGLGQWMPFATAGLATGAALLIVLVHRNLDDPRGLAPVRFGTLVLHLAASGVLLLAAVGAVP